MENLSISTQTKNWYDYPSHHFLHHYLRGKLGLNVGLNNNLEGLNQYLLGLHSARYYLIGADSGVGKTTFADFGFVLNAYFAAKKEGRKLHIFYYSFEISRVQKSAKWVSFFIYLKHGISMSSEYILARIENKPIGDKEDQLIMEAFEMVEELFNNITFIEDPVHPTFIYNSLIDNHFDKIGKVLRTEQTEQQKKEKRKGRIIGYQKNPGHEEDMTLIIVDHIALTASEKGMNTKDTIDRLSSYFVQLRNLFSATVVVIQQFNSDLQSFNRMMNLKSKGADIILPQKLDFGDSKYTYRDADVVIGLVSPFQFDLETFRGVDIEKFKSFYIAAVLMKNRYGVSNKLKHYLMNPIAGTFMHAPTIGSEMPPGMTNPDMDNKYLPFIKNIEKWEKLYSQPDQ